MTNSNLENLLLQGQTLLEEKGKLTQEDILNIEAGMKELESKTKALKKKYENCDFDNALDGCQKNTIDFLIYLRETMVLSDIRLNQQSKLIEFLFKSIEFREDMLIADNNLLEAAAILEVNLTAYLTKREIRVSKAKFAAQKRHEKTNVAKEKIRKIWSSGKYTSRDICAEQECADLNISFSTARKALRNTPGNK
ncbi:MAG: hypothetical protein V9E92_07395 [Methylotenera sp.]